jgi:hypothetical protein
MQVHQRECDLAYAASQEAQAAAVNARNPNSSSDYNVTPMQGGYTKHEKYQEYEETPKLFSAASAGPNRGSGLFRKSDFDLKPEVQEIIQSYDDMYLYADVAYSNGILYEDEYEAVQRLCIRQAAKYRRLNKVESGSKLDEVTNFVIDLVGSCIPFVGDWFVPSSEAYAATPEMVGLDKIASNIKRLDNLVAKAGFKYTVYELFDEATGDVKYIGRTRQVLETRKLQHWAADTEKLGLEIRPARYKGVELVNLNYGEGRIFEHLMYEGYIKKGLTLLNRIKPMAVNKVEKYMGYALEWLRKVKK